MTKILEQGLRDPSLFYEIGQMGRKSVERMTWAHYRAQFADAYKELITAADVS
jgi:hypothetical protein